MNTKDRDLVREASDYLIKERADKSYYTDSVEVLDFLEDLINQLEHNEKQLQLYKGVAEAAIRLRDLKDHKMLEGKDKHYMENKEKYWDSLNFQLHNIGECLWSCGYCPRDAGEALSQLPKGGEK